jgi:hypothetical protein
LLKKHLSFIIFNFEKKNWEKKNLKYLDKNYRDRIRVYLFIEKGIIKDVILQFESFIQGKWHPIVRYDCAHGFFSPG